MRLLPALVCSLVVLVPLRQSVAQSMDWPGYGGTPGEAHFSALTDVSAATVSRLGLAWTHEFDSARGLEATPVVVGGVLYTTSSWSKVYAFDARTGKPLWSFDPKVPGEVGFKACCDVVNRGVAYHRGRVFVGTLDGRLIALDAKTGKVAWSVVTVDQSLSYTITGAPRIVKDRVLIGNGGSEFGVRGYISAYDTVTGKLAWRFFTVPSSSATPDGAASDEVMAKARATWSGDFGRLGGGGTVWDAITYDADHNQVIFGTGNGTPWDETVRSPGGGDNLFLASIVAVDADTGRYRWHYQTTPGDVWDFDAAENLTLANLTIDGQPRKVVMQASKNGFFYVIDRSNGQLLSANNYVPQTWTTGMDPKTGRPVEAENARYTSGVFVSTPSGLGGHNWQPMAFSPVTKLAYIPAQEVPLAYKGMQPFSETPGGWNTGVDWSANVLPEDTAGLKAVRAILKGHLAAWDPVTQREVWRSEQGGPWNGGVLATAGGLVFEGTAKGEFQAYGADTGKTLWSFDTGIGIIASPVTYAIGGRQYVAVMAGYGGGYVQYSPFTENAGPRPNGRLFVFALDRNTPYVAKRTPPAAPVLVADTWSAEQHERGAAIYANVCSLCHGDRARSSGLNPDLRRVASLQDKDTWNTIVIGGVLKNRGMISFARWLSPDDAEAVRGYVASRAHHLAEQGN
jgi:quinohemoprotein ethanol dehydrogenase